MRDHVHGPERIDDGVRAGRRHRVLDSMQDRIARRRERVGAGHLQPDRRHAVFGTLLRDPRHGTSAILFIERPRVSHDHRGERHHQVRQSPPQSGGNRWRRPLDLSPQPVCLVSIPPMHEPSYDGPHVVLGPRDVLRCENVATKGNARVSSEFDRGTRLALLRRELCAANVPCEGFNRIDSCRMRQREKCKSIVARTGWQTVFINTNPQAFRELLGLDWLEQSEVVKRAQCGHRLPSGSRFLG